MILLLKFDVLISLSLALEKLTWSILVNSLGYDNNFDYKEWNDEFRNNFTPPPLTLPKENLSSPISSSPLLKNQSSPRNSSPISSSTSYLSEKFKILKISTSSSWREIRTAYRKLARVYHPDKYDNLPKKSRKRGKNLFKAFSNNYDKLGSLEFVV